MNKLFYKQFVYLRLDQSAFSSKVPKLGRSLRFRTIFKNMKKLWNEIKSWADEGDLHGIPRCCGMRFGFDAARPKFWSAIGFPKLSAKLGYISLRRWFARYDNQGYVPCEYHLLKWALLKRRPQIGGIMDKLTTDRIIRYEEGDISQDEAVALFTSLVKLVPLGVSKGPMGDKLYTLSKRD